MIMSLNVFLKNLNKMHDASQGIILINIPQNFNFILHFNNTFFDVSIYSSPCKYTWISFRFFILQKKSFSVKYYYYYHIITMKKKKTNKFIILMSHVSVTFMLNLSNLGIYLSVYTTFICSVVFKLAN